MTTIGSGQPAFVANGGSVLPVGTDVTILLAEVSSGQTSSGLFVHSGEVVQVDFGGTALDTDVLNGGNQDVFGRASGTFIHSGGFEFVGSSNVSGGGVAVGTTISIGGIQDIVDGAFADGTIISNGGTQLVEESNSPFGGIAENTIVLKGGLQHLIGLAFASSTTISSGGKSIVSNLALADATAVKGGLLQVESGGTTSGTTVSSGGVELVSGQAIRTTIFAFGKQQVFSGGI